MSFKRCERHPVVVLIRDRYHLESQVCGEPDPLFCPLCRSLMAERARVLHEVAGWAENYQTEHIHRMAEDQAAEAYEYSERGTVNSFWPGD
jgi:hypothetical protein